MQIRTLFRSALTLACLGFGTATLAQSAPAAPSTTSAPYSVIIGGTVTDPSPTYKAQQDNVIGVGANITGVTSNAFGWGASVIATGGNAFGNLARADSDFATAFGDQAHAGDPLLYPGNVNGGVAGAQTAIGAQSNVVGYAGVGLGAFSSVTSAGSQGVALGPNASVTAPNAVALGSSTLADQANTVAVGNRRIVGLMPGIDGYDAATIGQLDYLAAGFGGGASFAGGYFTAPTYSLSGNTFYDVGSALFYLDGRITALPAPGTGPVGPVGPKGDPGTGGSDPLAVQYDDASKQSVTLQGQGGTTIHNVAPGVASHDAANVSQVQQALATAKTYADAGDVKTLNWANAYTDRKFSQMGDRIDRVAAMGQANAQMVATFAGADPSQRNRIAAGVGFSGGHSAIAVGYQHVSASGHVAWNIGGSVTGGERSIGGGIGYSW